MPLPPRLLRELPGLETAFDEAAMRGHLQSAVFGSGSRWTLDRCEPDRPLLVAGEGCSVQYGCRVRDAADSGLYDPIVVGRVFPDRASCDGYMRRKLAPLVERVRKRPDLATFATPAAVIEPLHMVVHVWPLDGELPTLVDATEPLRMRRVLAAALGGRFAIDQLAIERVRYRRQRRCVLRYVLSGRGSGGEPERRVVYGKLTPRGGQGLPGDTLARLRAHFDRRDGGIRIPRPLGWRPELGLALLEEVAGEAEIGTALRARARGEAKADGPPLEAMLAAAARAAAALHRSGLRLGRPRTLEHRLADLKREVETTRLFAEAFAERASGWLGRLAELAQHARALPAGLCHGDFRHAQLFFAGDRIGLVDLDTICQSEPALDLGQFVAHLRTQLRQVAGDASPLEAELAEQFVREYVASAGVQDAPALRARAALHEAVGLLRTALHSAQGLAETRLDSASAAIEERLRGLG